MWTFKMLNVISAANFTKWLDFQINVLEDINQIKNYLKHLMLFTTYIDLINKINYIKFYFNKIKCNYLLIILMSWIINYEA